jgi:hypothetical protein
MCKSQWSLMSTEWLTFRHRWRKSNNNNILFWRIASNHWVLKINHAKITLLQWRWMLKMALIFIIMCRFHMLVVKGQGHQVKFLSHNILVNTLESTSFNGFWPNLVHRKSIGFQILLRTKYVPSLVKIHWRMLILECSQGCYVVTIWACDLANQ